MSVFGVSTKNNPEQTELARLILDNQHPIVLCTGKAGTGKNHVALAAALELVIEKRKYGQIMYARNPVQVGEKIGYLKGSLDEKLEPFMAVLDDNLQSIAKSNDKMNLNNVKYKIKVLPIFGIRGRNIDDAVVIVDECQNLDRMTLKTILTRLGQHTKIIMLGSYNQIDDLKQRAKDKCDFEDVVNILKEQDFAAHIELKKSMRSPYCALIDDLL